MRLVSRCSERLGLATALFARLAEILQFKDPTSDVLDPGPMASRRHQPAALPSQPVLCSTTYPGSLLPAAAVASQGALLHPATAAIFAEVLPATVAEG